MLDIVEHIKEKWDVYDQADENARSNFIDSLERFEELKSRLVADASSCTEEEVQESLQRF